MIDHHRALLALCLGTVACGGHSVETIERPAGGGATGASGMAGAAGSGVGGQGGAAQGPEAVVEFVPDVGGPWRFAVHDGYVVWVAQSGDRCAVFGRHVGDPAVDKIYQSVAEGVCSTVAVNAGAATWVETSYVDGGNRSFLFDRSSRELVELGTDLAGKAMGFAVLLGDEGAFVEFATPGGASFLRRTDLHGKTIQDYPIEFSPAVWTSEYLVLLLNPGFKSYSFATGQIADDTCLPIATPAGWVCDTGSAWAPHAPMGTLRGQFPFVAADQTGTYWTEASGDPNALVWRSFSDYKVTHKYRAKQALPGFPVVDGEWLYYGSADTIWRIPTSIVRGP